MSRVGITLGSILGISVAFLATASASAQETTSEVGGGVTSFGIGDWLGLGLRLALVVGVIWGGVAAMRWYVRRSNGAGRRSASGALEIIETHALGPNRTLHLVRVGGRAVLVGATPERITQLMTVEDPEELERMVPRPDETPTHALGSGVPSLLSSLGLGMNAFRVMNARRQMMNERLSTERASRRGSHAVATVEDSESVADRKGRAGRFASLRSALTATPRTARSPRASRGTRAVVVEPEPEPRQSLFERTLASIDAIQVTNGVNAAEGLRARTGYGQAVPQTPSMTPRQSSAAQRSRDAQIANLQRAITAARRNAG